MSAANDMAKERLEQFPKIMGPENMTPDYGECIRISTEASLRKMLAPGCTGHPESGSSLG